MVKDGERCEVEGKVVIVESELVGKKWECGKEWMGGENKWVGWMDGWGK